MTDRAKFQTKAHSKPLRLPIPPNCDLPFFNTHFQSVTVACHQSLPCQRCGLCLHHCTCAKQAEKPQGENLEAVQLPLREPPKIYGRH
jgi:hypothetical protein